MESSFVRRAAGAAIAASLLASCGLSGAHSIATSSNTMLTFAAYGGAGQQAMIDTYQKPYTAAHPEVTFVNTSPPDLAQLKAQVSSRAVKWDVVAVSPAAATQGCGTLFEELDFSGLDTTDLVPQTVGKCYLGNWINATPIAYRTEAFPDPKTAPKTAADFFDVRRFPGQRGITPSLQNGILEYPLLADGVAPKDIYPLDVDRSLKKLSTIRRQITLAPNIGALQQAVGAKQVDMFLLPDSRLVPLLNDGNDLTIVWDKTVTSLNAFAVPKGSANKEAARRFIQTVVSPAAVTGMSEALGTAPVNTAARPNLPPNARKVQVYGPVNTGVSLYQDIGWYAQNFDQATAKLNEWMGAGE
ncbi:extracellular solute-binding protein [Cryptosporangium sp. NPDC051539]|uniref:extracellular solute-binding protein n=1 Tax=Cryptosporangium sp. NPDC051539 TaxID=3363962 RepID=UPI00379C1962